MTTRTDRIFAFLDAAVIVVGITTMVIAFGAFISLGIAAEMENEKRAAAVANAAQCVE